MALPWYHHQTKESGPKTTYLSKVIQQKVLYGKQEAGKLVRSGNISKGRSKHHADKNSDRMQRDGQKLPDTAVLLIE